MIPLSFRRHAASFSAAALCALTTACAPRSEFRTALPATAPVRSAEFEQAIGSLLSFGFVRGNRLETLENGDRIFPAMLAAIRGAQRSINFETFVFYHGEIPEFFVAALEERARAGVKVNVIIDAVGGSKSRRYHGRLKDAGVKLAIYHPLLWPDLRRANNRSHRKLLIVDGRVGFIGGVGIGQEWAGDARSPEEWRELHYRVTGPVVAQLQGAFHENWRKTGGDVLLGRDYFPALAPAGTAAASVVFSSPRHARTQIELLYHIVFASVRRSLDITNAYFLPDDAMVEAICAAARRGVRVRILMPGEETDQPAIRRGSRKRWAELMAAGVELYEFQPTMIHAKLLVADGRFVTLGSSNFDPRSLLLNDEANLNVLDAAFAAEQTRIFERDLRRSRKVTAEDAGLKVSELPVQVVQTPLEPQL